MFARAEQLAALLREVPAAAYMCDAEGLITFFNERAVEFWGRRPRLNDVEDRFCGSFKLFLPDGSPLEHDRCWMALALAEDKPYNQCHVVIERPDGQRWDALAFANPLHDEHGELVGAINVLVDVTERRTAALERARLAAIVDSSDDAIVGQDLDGTVRSWNAAAERVFGYCADEIVGRSITRIVPEDRIDEEASILARLLAGEHVRHFDTVGRRKDGSLVPVSLCISPIRGTEGRIAGVSKIARDISERERAGRRIEELLGRLREADRLKDEFLAMLAHELRNPLAASRNISELLERDGAGPETLEQIGPVLSRQLNQMVRLVDDLLDISRITRGEIPLRRERTLLNSVVAAAVDTVRGGIDERRQELWASLPEGEIWVHGDAARLEQVCVNLLDNASKYTDEGGRIELSLARSRGRAVLRVRDTGCGIPADLLPHVFDLFRQGDRTSERARGGLGVGLSLVQRIVNLHHGTVEARSTVGRGSEFVVRLPALRAPTSAAPARARTGAGTGPSHEVVVVDDNVDAAESLAALLRGAGHDVRTAHDGATALELVSERGADVVIADIGLPDVDGYEVARRIRRDSTHAGTVLVALTGYGRPSDFARAREAGFDHHLVKPVGLAELQELLARPGPLRSAPSTGR